MYLGLDEDQALQMMKTITPSRFIFERTLLNHVTSILLIKTYVISENVSLSLSFLLVFISFGFLLVVVIRFGFEQTTLEHFEGLFSFLVLRSL